MVVEIDIDNILPKNIISDRDNISIDDSIIALSKSIKKNGLLQPIVVKKIDNEKYRIVCGQRRIVASKLASLTKIKATIKEFDSQVDEIASILSENNERKNISRLDAIFTYSKILYLLHYDKEVDVASEVNGQELFLFLKSMIKEKIKKSKKKPYDTLYDKFEKNCQKLSINSSSILLNKFLLAIHPKVFNFLETNKINIKVAYYIHKKENTSYYLELLNYIEQSNEKINIEFIDSFFKKKSNKKRGAELNKERILKLMETNDAEIISALNSMAIKLENKLNSKKNLKKGNK